MSSAQPIGRAVGAICHVLLSESQAVSLTARTYSSTGNRNAAVWSRPPSPRAIASS